MVSGLISDCDWNTFTVINDVDYACSTFVERLQSFITQSLKEKNMSSKNNKLKPWITSGLLKSIRHGDNLSKQ